MGRGFWVWLHRWVGLAMTVFLIIVALTGSLIAFNNELDRWLNPTLFNVPQSGAAPMDAIFLHDRAEKEWGGHAQVDYINLHVEPGRSLVYMANPLTNPLTGTPYELSYDEVFFNPYTGDKLGARNYAETSLSPLNLMNFLNRLHYSLALPGERWHRIGGYVLGIVALMWTLDCFISLYLTLPARRKQESTTHQSTGGSRRWLARWWNPSWRVKRNASAYRLNYDLHRAGGLWTFVLLFVLAWSSVALNLGEVYNPVTSTLFGMREPAQQSKSAEHIKGLPLMNWSSAHTVAQRLMNVQATSNGFKIEYAEMLALDRGRGVYTYNVHSSMDLSKWAETSVTFDAVSGQFIRSDWPGHPGERPGDTLTHWLTWLHMAVIFGLTMQVVICVMGIIIATLCVTGVVVWWKKRKARLFRRSNRTVVQNVESPAC